MDSALQQAMIDQAEELKTASERLIQSAEKVRTAQILNELVRLLDNQENKRRHTSSCRPPGSGIG